MASYPAPGDIRPNPCVDAASLNITNNQSKKALLHLQTAKYPF